VNDFPEIETIRKKVLEIADLARRSIRISVKALMNRHSGLCDQVKEIEKETDFINVETEDKCLEVLASHELPAKLFRFVAASIDISSRFERIADLAVEICEYCIRGLPKPIPEPSFDTQKMGKIFEDMIDIDIEALSRDAVVSVEKLRNKENDMKQLYEKIHANFVSYVHKHPESFDDAILLLKIASALERAGELTCKIANRIVYAVEGRRIWLG